MVLVSLFYETFAVVEMKRIEDFHDVPLYSITKEILNNTRLQLLKKNICLSYLPEYFNEIWNIILELRYFHLRRSTPIH